MRLFIILAPTARSFLSIKFPIKILSKVALFGRFVFASNFESVWLKTWVIYHLIKSS
jgi:hypothetical protein